MKHRLTETFGTLALLVAVSGTASSTVLNFAMNEFGGLPANNEDLTVTYGSNVTAGNFIGATAGVEGFTPNISLMWAPTGGEIPGDPDIDILEFHSADTFTGAGLTVPVLQLDVDISNHNELPEHPTLDFIPDAGWAVRIHEFKYGNATDQGSQAPHPWTFSILELPSLTPTGSSFTTAALGAGDNGVATFNFTGQPGVSYRLLFDDGPLECTSFDCHNPRTGIDDIRFSQVQASAEPNADFDNDNDIDGKDFLIWQRGFGLTGQTNNSNGDADGNGSVGATDLAAWQTQYGTPPLIAAVSVPEPTSGILLMALVVACGAVRKRRS